MQVSQALFVLVFSLLFFSGCCTGLLGIGIGKVSDDQKELKSGHWFNARQQGSFIGVQTKNGTEYYVYQFSDLLAGEGRILEIIIPKNDGPAALIIESKTNLTEISPALFMDSARITNAKPESIRRGQWIYKMDPAKFPKFTNDTLGFWRTEDKNYGVIVNFMNAHIFNEPAPPAFLLQYIASSETETGTLRTFPVEFRLDWVNRSYAGYVALNLLNIVAVPMDIVLLPLEVSSYLLTRLLHVV